MSLRQTSWPWLAVVQNKMRLFNKWFLINCVLTARDIFVNVRHLGFKLGRRLGRDKKPSQGGVRPTYSITPCTRSHGSTESLRMQATRGITQNTQPGGGV